MEASTKAKYISLAEREQMIAQNLVSGTWRRAACCWTSVVCPISSISVAPCARAESDLTWMNRTVNVAAEPCRDRREHGRRKGGGWWRHGWGLFGRTVVRLYWLCDHCGCAITLSGRRKLTLSPPWCIRNVMVSHGVSHGVSPGVSAPLMANVPICAICSTECGNGRRAARRRCSD